MVFRMGVLPAVALDFAPMRDALGANCPTPSKVIFASQETAERRAGELGFRAYLCLCNRWHLTSQIEYEDPRDGYTCPVCGLPCDEYSSCGCYEDLHYGA
jgi:hypothetical protein